MTFPFHTHLTLKQADHLQALRLRLRDGELVMYARYHLFPQGISIPQYHGFVKRNPRPKMPQEVA